MYGKVIVELDERSERSKNRKVQSGDSSSSEGYVCMDVFFYQSINQSMNETCQKDAMQ